MSDLRLRTVKKAASETGSSPSFFRQLMNQGKLTRFRINRAVYISLAEFEAIATPVKRGELLIADAETFKSINDLSNG